MATASVSSTSECCICFESFTIPKVLPCGHTFCIECIQRLIGDKTQTFHCPSCQQDVKIPEGGAKEFITNYIVQTSKNTTQKREQPPSTIQETCPNHKQREVDYYCNNCNVGLCSKCIFQQHKDHKTLDIECEETRNEAVEKLKRSQNIFQTRIKTLDKNRSTLLESFKQVKSLCENSIDKVTEKTEQIVADLRKNCKQIIQDIRTNLEENRIKVEDKEIEITSEINVLESNVESIISPSTETTLNILVTSHRLIEIETLDESKIDYNMCIQYLQWVGKNFSLDIDQLGLAISKRFYTPGSYQFLFNVSDIENSSTVYYSKNKFRNNNLVWSCGVQRSGDDPLYIDIKLLPDDNPRLNHCVIDGQISLLNINDDSKTKTRKASDMRLQSGVLWSWWDPISWSNFTDMRNGYLNSNGQFVIQFDLEQISEIEFSQ